VSVQLAADVREIAAKPEKAEATLQLPLQRTSVPLKRAYETSTTCTKEETMKNLATAECSAGITTTGGVEIPCSEDSEPCAEPVVANQRYGPHRGQTLPVCAKHRPILELIYRDVMGLDHPAKPAGCQHHGLRAFTFKNGETIKLCTSCTHFAAARRATLAKTTGEGK